MRVLRAALPALFVLVAFVLLGLGSAHAAGIKVQNVNYDAETATLIVKGKIDGLGDNVNVVLRNLSTGAQLAAATTSKQFEFAIPVPSFDDVPCEVLLLAGGVVATGEVKHGPGLCTRYETLLSGLVTDDPIPYATVSVTLDGVTYTTTADESGFYSLDLITANLNQLVRIDAAAEDPETGDTIEFVNFAGAFSRVLEGNANGNVTNVTTASYVLTLEANGGIEPTTADELAEAETAIDATELFQLAALIKLIVDDPAYSLPDGQTSLIGFISDPVAVDAFAATVPQEDIDAALAAILADSNLVAGFALADIPDRYYDFPLTSPGFIPQRGGITLEFNTDGSGNFLSYIGNTATGLSEPFSWLIDSGRLIVDLNSPSTVVSFPAISDIESLTPEERQLLEDNNINQIREEITQDIFIYTRVADGTGVDFVRREIRSTKFYPPIPYGNQGMQLILSQQTVQAIETEDAALRSSLDLQPIPFTASCGGAGQAICAVGYWGGEFHRTTSPGTAFGSGVPGAPWPTTVYADIALLSSDGMYLGELSNSSANWTVNADGALVISFGDGWTQTMQVLETQNSEYGIYSEFTTPTDRFAQYSLFIKADGRAALVTGDYVSPAGEYYNSAVNAWRAGSFDANGVPLPRNRFGWEFEFDGTGINNIDSAEFDCDGDGTADGIRQLRRALTWMIDDTRFIIDRRPDIYPGFATRVWDPILLTTVDGRRVIYTVEQSRWDDYNGGAGGEKRLLIAPRINIQIERSVQSDYACVDVVPLAP